MSSADELITTARVLSHTMDKSGAFVAIQRAVRMVRFSRLERTREFCRITVNTITVTITDLTFNQSVNQFIDITHLEGFIRQYTPG